MSRRTAAGKKDKELGGPQDQASQDKQQKLLAREDVGHFSMIRALHLADVITEMNGFCGFMSVLNTLRYCLGPPDELRPMWAALGFIPFGLFFDFLDGRVARWRGKSSLMGQELDSLADLVSFGVAPAAAAFALGLRTQVDTLLLTFFVLCGLTRLARFNVTVATLPKDATGKSAYFEGFPIPSSLGLVSAMATCVYTGRVLERLPLGVLAAGAPYEVHGAALVFGLWGCVMVSRTIHVPKP